MRKSILRSLLALAALGTWSMHGAWAAEQGTVKILAPWESTGNVYPVGPSTLLFHGVGEGIMYIEDGEGALDAALFVCPGTRTIDLESRKVSASGHCIMEVEGAQIYARFECKGEPGQCDGNFTLTGGTGRFAGITGSGEILIRTAIAALAADARSGATVSGSAGLAIWPSLSYKIPGN